MAGRRRIARLRCSVQNYAWGRRGKDSQVGRLYSLQSKLPLDDHTPYAELWMGTHDSGPSFVVIEHEHRADGGDGIGFEGSNGVGEDGVNAPLGLDACDTGGTSEMLLKDWIASNPSFLGDKVRSKWGADLPFLFKV
jgi:mannose-6-phosphate isomerase